VATLLLADINTSTSTRWEEGYMRPIIGLVASALLAAPALADNHDVIRAQMQDLSDAIASGHVAIWDKYLDPNVIYAEEDDSYKGKAEMLKEIVPLPKGLSGTIKIEMLSYHEDGDVAVGLFRQNETEHYYGQTIYAKYLTNTTWRKRPDGWKMIAAQVLAERTDPPAITLSSGELRQYAGTYKLKDSEDVYSIQLTRGQLVGTRGSRKPAAWSAEARDVFFVARDPRIRKIFQRNGSGQIVGFVERRESWDIVWKKIG
jgi:ketosteroid isomerase-like protein